jgi:hypothetical protein
MVISEQAMARIKYDTGTVAGGMCLHGAMKDMGRNLVVEQKSLLNTQVGYVEARWSIIWPNELKRIVRYCHCNFCIE